MYRDELRLTAHPCEVVIEIAREQRFLAHATSKHHALNHMLIARTRQIVEVEQNDRYGFQKRGGVEVVDFQAHSSALLLERGTKSTKDFEKLRNSEADKIRCGRRHFEALNVDFSVVTASNGI